MTVLMIDPIEFQLSRNALNDKFIIGLIIAN